MKTSLYIYIYTVGNLEHSTNMLPSWWVLHFTNVVGFFLVMTVNSCFFPKMSFIVITIHTSVIFVKETHRLMYSIGFIYFEFGIKDRDGKTILNILKRWSDAVNRKLTDTSQNKRTTGQTKIHKTVHTKLKIGQHEPQKNTRGEPRCSVRESSSTLFSR